MSLTPKQRIFADHYLKSNNATQSYKFAYPNIKNDETASACSARLLTNAKVIEYLAGVQKELAKKEVITVERIVNKLVKEAFGADIEDVAEIGEDGNLKLIPGGPLSGIDGISFSESESSSDNDKGSSSSKTKSISVKKKDQLKALDMLMKTLGIGAYGRGTEDQGRVFESNAGRVLDAIKGLRGKERS